MDGESGYINPANNQQILTRLLDSVLNRTPSPSSNLPSLRLQDPVSLKFSVSEALVSVDLMWEGLPELAVEMAR